MTEAWYREHLDTAIRNIPEEPQKFLTADTAFLESHIAEKSLLKDPLAVFTRADADLKTVRACLRLYIIRTHQALPSKEDARLELSQKQVGILVLHWLLSAKGKAGAEFAHDVEFAQSLCHCMVAAAQSSLLWRWILVPKLTDDDSSRSPLRRRRWKGNILRDMNRAQAYWSQDPRKLDQALNSYLWNHHHSHYWAPADRLSSVSASKWIVRILPRASKSSYSLHLYDRCLGAFEDLWNSDPIDKELVLGRMELMHPTQPISGRLLRYYRMSESDPNVAQQVDLFRNPSRDPWP